MSAPALNQKIWVVFTGKTDIAWLRFLKPGFRHCYALINDGQKWMSIDPLSSYTDIQIYHHIAPDFNLPNWLNDQGYRVVQSKINKPKLKSMPPMIFTCVEAIKRILGVRNLKILTPWQLYQYLKNERKNYG